MRLEELYKDLSLISGLKKSRLNYANKVLKDLALLPKLITVLLMINDKVSCRAAWVFELVCEKYIQAILPYLDDFTENLHKIHLDSTIRPVAKVCLFIAKAHVSKKPNLLQKALTSTHKATITEACFDWLISNQKVAAKVYAMETLLYLGKDSKWIHTELISILEHDFPNQSAAYKAKAKHIFKNINKLEENKG